MTHTSAEPPTGTATTEERRRRWEDTYRRYDAYDYPDLATIGMSVADAEQADLRAERARLQGAVRLLLRSLSRADAALDRVRALAEEHIVGIDTALVLEALDTPSAANRPGSTAEQLPDHILALLPRQPYTSTACDTAARLGDLAESAGIGGREELRRELEEWAQRLHGRCRLNQKFTGELCASPSHRQAEDAADAGPGGPEEAR